MAKKGGTVKRLFLILILLALALIVFILFGGADLLKSAGNKAESIKETVEKQATTIEKKVEKVKEAVSPGDKK